MKAKWTEERREKQMAQIKELGYTRKGKHMSEESKQKLSLSQKKRLAEKPFSDEYKQLQSKVQKERYEKHPCQPFTEEHKRKISETRKLLYSTLSEEHKQKISKTLLAKKPWLGKHHTEATKQILREKTSKYMMGNKSNLGKKLTEEHKQHIREGCKGINTGKRAPFSEEWRRKLGDVSRGKKRNFTPEHKRNMAKAHYELWTRQRISKPQKELFIFLKQIFVDASLELPIKTNRTYRFADIGVPSLKIDFEYDGEYWHNEKRQQQDKDRDAELAEVGWITFRVNSQALKLLTQQQISLQEIMKK